MDDIYSYMVSRSEDDWDLCSGYVLWFSDSFPNTEFKNEELLFKYYIDYSSRLDVPLRYTYLESFIYTELKRLLIETRVKVPGTESLNYDEPVGLESAYRVTREYLLNEFKVIESLDVNVRDFPVAADTFISKRLESRLVEELSSTYERLSSKENSSESLEYALDNLILLRDIYDKSILEDLQTTTTKATTDFQFVCDTGIPAIDNDCGGIYTSQLFGIEAQPGTGKTRFAFGTWAYRAAVLYKRNVIYYMLEQSKAEGIAMLVARHCYTLYNIQISDSMILKGKVPAELQAKVEAAEIDLFESGKYGKIYVERADLYEGSLTQTFRKDDKLKGPFDMIIIDYMGLMMQKSDKYKKDMLEYEVINRAFRKFKSYVERTGKCGIAISQFNQKGIDAGKADKEITTDMAQGGIAVYRHTDQNFSLSRSVQMKAMQKCRISQPKVRSTQGFGSVILDTRLAFSYFYQTTQQV